MTTLDDHPHLKADVDAHLGEHPDHAVNELRNLYGDLTAVTCSCGIVFDLGDWTAPKDDS